MVKQVQHVGHDTSGANAYTGAAREITVDTGANALRVHDGVTLGGHAIISQAAMDLRYFLQSLDLDIAATKKLGFQPGTESLPGLRVAGDTNTGIYAPAGDQLAFALGGTQRILLTSSAFTLTVAALTLTGALTLGTDLAITEGGTGGSSAADARTNLGLAKPTFIPFKCAALFGLKVSNTAGDTANDLDIAAGECLDDAGTYILTLSAALTKRLDATWAVGTGNGGYESGQSKGNSEAIAIWLIGRSDTGVVDVMASDSFSAPTLPTNYDKKRLIWGVVTNGSAGIQQFTSVGDECWITSEPVDSFAADSSITGSTWETGAALAPPNSIVEMFILAVTSTPVANLRLAIYLKPKNATVTVDSSTAVMWVGIDNGDPEDICTAARVITNASREFEYAAAESGAQAVTLQFKVRSYRMPWLSSIGT